MCKSKTVIPILLCLFSFVSCEEKNNQLSGTGYLYHLRPCNALNVNNAWLEEFSYKDDTIDEHGFNVIRDLQKDSIDSDCYLLRLCVNEAYRNYPFFLYPPFNDEVAYELESDRIMEDQLVAYYENRPKTRSGGSYEVAFAVFNIEYRNEALEDLKVFATEPVFGKEPGDCLNDKISVYGGPEPFYFDKDKNLIPIKEKPWGSLADYLAFSSMTPAILYLQLTEKPQEVPVTLRFAIELKVEGKEPFRDTTRAVKLL